MNYTKYIIPILIILISVFGFGIRGIMTTHDGIQYFINILIAIAVISKKTEFSMTNKESLYPGIDNI